MGWFADMFPLPMRAQIGKYTPGTDIGWRSG